MSEQRKCQQIIPDLLLRHVLEWSTLLVDVARSYGRAWATDPKRPAQKERLSAARVISDLVHECGIKQSTERMRSQEESLDTFWCSIPGIRRNWKSSQQALHHLVQDCEVEQAPKWDRVDQRGEDQDYDK